jgi:Flp pilus assembly pilin Flp
MGSHGIKFFKVKSEQGQTMVEYILLLAVAVGLVYTLMNSALFKRIFGDKGSFGGALKASSEFNYRHGAPIGSLPDVPRENREPNMHPTYSDGTESRFFGPKEKYPQ